LFRILLILILTSVFIYSCEIETQTLSQKDVTFFGTGKVSRYQQIKDGSHKILKPLFFAEIFISTNGVVKNAKIKFPKFLDITEELKYRYSESDEIGDVMYLSGFAENYEDLEIKFPMGDYSFSFETSEGTVRDSVVSYKDKSFPIHPKIILKQLNKVISIDQVDPKEELIITWPIFSEGRADENGLLDDPIFVAIDSCKIEDVVHSGRPFEKNGYLTFRTNQYIVAAGTLEPGQKYSMYVEHAIFTDTQNENGMPAFATLASSTYMDFNTTGIIDPDYCQS
tara:strand:- start:75 stop:920 length:846 start_codon:yes stop_codon:yes gene_type:complete